MGRRSRARMLVMGIAGLLAISAVIAMVILFSRPQAPTSGASTTPTAAPPSATTPSPTPTPTPTPTPPAAAAASEIVMRATGFDIVAEDGSTLYSFEWSDDALAIVAALSETFGEAPITSIAEGDGSHFPDYTSYRWDGFEFQDMIETSEGKPRSEYVIPSYVVLTSADSNGVTLTSEFGVAVGMLTEDVRRLDPDEEVELGPEAGLRFFFGTERTGFATPDVPDYRYALWVRTTDDGRAVESITYRPYSRL